MSTTAQRYQDWARAFHGHAFGRRSAERNAAFLLPRLHPGDRVVDIGCGPGTITIGLAERVAPGEVVGIDRDPEYIAAAGQRSATNLRFEVGDGAALPFDDASVDVAFLHAVLQHVDSPSAVLREARRIVRPGGLVAIGDLDMDAYLLHPSSGELQAALALDRHSRRNPDIGRRLPALLHHAGFPDVDYRVAANVAATPEATAGVASGAVRRLEAEPYIAHVVAEGWATADELERMTEAWRAWAEVPGATFVTLWCEVLAT